LRQQFQKHSGHEVKDLGDGFLVAFARAGDALACAIAAQRALTQPEDGQAVTSSFLPSLRLGQALQPSSLQVRMALHTGEAEPEEGDYHGLAVNRTARLLLAAHGGQILCSEASACLLQRDLPARVRLTDLGVYRLRDLPLPERLFQVEWP
jgi:class 3 adenylate cyclase